jgi:hypothetical protein
MADSTLNVSAGKFMSENVVMTVRMTGLKVAMLRLRLAVPLLWLAAKVAGVGLSLDFDQSKKW